MSHHFKHHMGCGCPECMGRGDRKKKLFIAMVFFIGMAIFHGMIAGILHIALHGKEVCKRE